MTIDRRTFLKLAAGGAVASAAVGGAVVYRSPRAREIYVRLMRPGVGPRIADAPGTEVLYNGISLPSPWPPYRRQLERELEFPPYLQKPPAVIPVDVGRQLFVDDFLIEESSLDRSYHSASYIEGNPVLAPATEWDRKDGAAVLANRPQRPTAMPFSDGVWFDPADHRYKIWYTAGYGRVTCYAESADGLEWVRPALDVIPGTNIVLEEVRDSSAVWLDLDEPNPHLRYKMLIFLQNIRHLRQFVSSDGIHWTPAGLMGPSGDRTTLFYNPFRKMWVYSLRNHQQDHVSYLGRHRRYVESPGFCSLTPWTSAEAVAWIAADDLDRPRADIGFQPELYNLDCVAYESLMLGLFSMYYGDPSDRQKPNHIQVGFSRDGFHWSRPSRDAFINVSERAGDWNWANVQSAGGCCLVVGDRLYFYVSGRAGVQGTVSPGACSTGLATLRRDGFASLDALADRLPRIAGLAPRAREVTTRTVRFSGSHLFVNAAVDGGELRAEVLDAAGKIIQPFSAANCTPVTGDSTRVEVTWPGASIADLAGQPVRFRFYLRDGRLYAFWVAATPRGSSRGYVGAGGPDFSGSMDVE